jgi:hypothetical protein
MIILPGLQRGCLTITALFLTIAIGGCGAPANTSTSSPAPIRSSAPQGQPITPIPSVMPEPTTGDASAAFQTVLDYYDAINRRAYDRAYHLWAQGGAASNQTFDQFKAGFANTIQVSIQFGMASPSSIGVTVPITVVAIVNAPNNPPEDQLVQRFGGTYTVEHNAAGWQLASANITATNGDAPLPADTGDPLTLLQSYYAAIDGRDFPRAYTYWSDNGAASQQTFMQFSQGFATTNHVAIELGQPQSNGAAGSIYAEVPIVIVATQQDGSQQAFCGTYTLRRLNVPPFDRLGWRIERADIASHANVQPGSDQAKSLLTASCKA